MESPSGARRAGFAAFFLLGWTILLVPSLVREVEAAFSIDDAAMGLGYLAYNAVYVGGTLLVGTVAVRRDAEGSWGVVLCSSPLAWQPAPSHRRGHCSWWDSWCSGWGLASSTPA